jgi:hypothetical protein
VTVGVGVAQGVVVGVGVAVKAVGAARAERLRIGGVEAADAGVVVARAVVGQAGVAVQRFALEPLACATAGYTLITT